MQFRPCRGQRVQRSDKVGSTNVGNAVQGHLSARRRSGSTMIAVFEVKKEVPAEVRAEEEDIRMKTPSALSTVFLLGLFSAMAVGQEPKPSNATGTATKTDHTIITSMTSAEFQQIVQAMGFECTRGKDEAGKENEFFTFRAEGYKVAAFVTAPSFVTLYNSFTDVNPTLATVNEWNQLNSFSRAYIDKAGDAVLESDLILGGGVTRESVELFVKTYRDSVARWARFLLDRKK